MARAYPADFRNDVVAVARRNVASVREIAGPRSFSVDAYLDASHSFPKSKLSWKEMLRRIPVFGFQ
jgi:hypothetical protein